jgi:GxxExxY protein
MPENPQIPPVAFFHFLCSPWPVELNPSELPHILVSACLEVHHQIGPGLVKEAYKACLAEELRMRELLVEQDRPVHFRYRNATIRHAATIDFLVEDLVVVQVEAIESLLPIHKRRLSSLLHLSGFQSGLLVNFDVDDLREGGIKRIVVTGDETRPS